MKNDYVFGRFVPFRVVYWEAISYLVNIFGHESGNDVDGDEMRM